MFQVRIHGRGGQGVVTAAEMLSIAAFEEGRHAQAFPSFGSERTGAPVVAFCRIADKEIRLREPIMEPDALIIQDPTLLHQVDVFAGLKTGRLHPDQHQQDLRGTRPGRLRPRPTGRNACAPWPRPIWRSSHVGRPVPNVPLLGGFAAMSGIIKLESVIKAINDKFSGKVADGNIAAATEAYKIVPAWKMAGGCPCLSRSKVPTPSPRPSRCAGRK